MKEFINRITRPCRKITDNIIIATVLSLVIMVLGSILSGIMLNLTGFRTLLSNYLQNGNLEMFLSSYLEFIGIWIMFYLNIHCGLMIISYEKQLLNIAFATSLSLAVIVSLVPSCTAISNALGRIGYSTLSDKLKQRNTIYQIIFISCIVISCTLSEKSSLLSVVA